MLAEIVENTLPKRAHRADIHKHPHYYGVRNHIIDFLVSRSKSFAEEMQGTAYDPRRVPVVRPGCAASRSSPTEIAPSPRVMAGLGSRSVARRSAERTRRGARSCLADKRRAMTSR